MPSPDAVRSDKPSFLGKKGYCVCKLAMIYKVSKSIDQFSAMLDCLLYLIIHFVHFGPNLYAAKSLEIA